MGNLGGLSPEGSVAVGSPPVSYMLLKYLLTVHGVSGWRTGRVDLDQSPGHRVDTPAQVAYARRRKTPLRHPPTSVQASKMAGTVDQTWLELQVALRKLTASSWAC